MPITFTGTLPTAAELLGAIGPIRQAEVLWQHPRELRLLLEKIGRLAAGLPAENPCITLADDLSAICINGLPLILLGSNDWMLKQALPERHLLDKASALGHIVASRLDRISARKRIGIVIPEKDRVAIPALNLTPTRTEKAIDRASRAFLNAALPHEGDDRIYQQLLGSFRQRGITPLLHYDSHYTLESYLRFTRIILGALGEPLDLKCLRPHIVKQLAFLDLGQRFLHDYQGDRISCLKDKHPDIRILLNTGFAQPLSKSICVVECGKPVFDAKVLILGDSHASIHGLSKLTHIFSFLFRSTTFVWDPFLQVESTPEQFMLDDYDYAFFETTQRFIFGNF